METVRVTECPNIFNSIGSSSNTINFNIFNQIDNISFNIYKDVILSDVDRIYKEFKYEGSSVTLFKSNEYMLLLSILKLYLYTRSVNTDINDWLSFINLYDFSKVISKLNCDRLYITRMVDIIDNCINGIAFEVTYNINY